MPNKRLWVDELKPGMRLAAPIMNHNQVILDYQTLLTEDLIDLIRKRPEIMTVLVEELEIDRPLSNWEIKVRENYEKTVHRMKNVFSSARESKQVPINEMVELTSSTINNLLSENFVLQSLKTLNSIDEYTYNHSINVGVLCGVIGKWLKYDKDTMFMLVLSGILHDIGKSQIPLEILNKPGKLTKEEMAVMKRHTVLGYDILKNAFNIPEEVKLAVLQHHERVDGSGYPFALSSTKINDFAKIVSVADVYDAVTSDRVYQKARSPFELIDIFEEEMFIRLDSSFCLPMLTQIKNSLIGRPVITKDGRRAKIAFIGMQATDDILIQTEDDEFVSINMNEYGQIKF